MKPGNIAPGFPNRGGYGETPPAVGTITRLDVSSARPGRTAKDGAGSRAEKIPPRIPIPAQVGGYGHPHMPNPPTRAISLAPFPSDGTACVPRAHHGPVRGTAGIPPPVEHPRQPNQSRWSIPHRTCRWPADRFFAHRFRRDEPLRWWCRPSITSPA